MPLRFHWSLSQAGDRWRKTLAPAAQSGVPNLPAHVEFCRCAERNGIDSLLLAFSFARPDPVVLASALGVATTSITLMIAGRPGVFAPAVFVQQINTLSALLGGRVSVNLVAGHSPHEHGYYGDFLGHDERYSRAGELLDICAAFWRRDGDVEYHGLYYQVEKGRLGTPFVSARRTAPEIYLSGNSPQAEALAARHASCLLRYPDTPERLRGSVRPLVDQGVEVGLRLAILGRPTGEEARRDAAALREEAARRAGTVRRDFVGRTDSVAFHSTLDLADGDSPWLTSSLWTGLVPYLGEVCLVGSADDIATGILELADAGISQFLLSGWPDEEEMEFFGREILPRL